MTDYLCAGLGPAISVTKSLRFNLLSPTMPRLTRPIVLAHTVAGLMPRTLMRPDPIPSPINCVSGAVAPALPTTGQLWPRS